MNRYIDDRWLEFILGVIVLLGAVAFVIFALAQIDNEVNFRRSTYRLFFSNIGDLSEHDQVKIGGVEVGEVVNITVDEEQLLPVVTISLWGEIQLPVDSKARILNRSFLGGKYIAITPGHSLEYLESRAILNHTVDAQSLEDIISRSLFIVQQDALEEITGEE